MNLDSNMIMHLKIHPSTMELERNNETFMEDKLFEYNPGLIDPKPFDPNDTLSKLNDNYLNSSEFDIQKNYETDEKNYKTNDNIDIQTYNRRIYTTMQSFIEYWPKTTDVSCFWCCHQFQTQPCAIPETIHNDLFKVKGCYCSFNCAMAHLFDIEKGSNMLWEKLSILNLMMKKFGDKVNNTELKPAPPREALKSFGGYLTLDEFRKGFTKMYNVVSPPILITCPQIDETSYGNEIKTSNKKFIPVDQDRIKQADQSLRLKRNKPLPNHIMALDHLLNIQHKYQ